MSRIGKQPVKLPTGVTYTHSGDTIVIKGSKGSLSWKTLPGVNVIENDGALNVTIDDVSNAQQKAYW